MEKRSLFLYSAIVVIGLGAMIGVILFLRARNAPEVDQVGLLQSGIAAPSRSTVTTTRTLPGVPPYTPLDKTPVARPFTEEDEAKLDTKIYPEVSDPVVQQP